MASKKQIANEIIKDIKRVAKEVGGQLSRDAYRAHPGCFSQHTIAEIFGTWGKAYEAAGFYDRTEYEEVECNGAKILILDIETKPNLAYVWGLYDQTIALNQIKEDWCIIAWAAKFYREEKIVYKDQRKARDVHNDKEMLIGIRDLIDEADVIVTQNGKKFDQKKLNARFIINGIKPPSPVKHFDTALSARRIFGFTSNKLEYLSEKLCVKYKKSKHQKFPGFELWKECLAGNLEAWEEMEEYNKLDILTLEELFEKIYPWDTAINFELYNDKPTEKHICEGSWERQDKFLYTGSGKYYRFTCNKCGAHGRGKKNLFSPAKRESLKTK